MAVNVADLQARLTADTSQYTSALTEATRLAERFTERLGGIDTLLSRGFTVAAFVKVSDAILEVTKRAGEMAERFEHIEAMTGLAARSLEKYDVLLNRTGLSLEDLAVGFRRLNQQIVEATTGGEEAAAKFARFGIATRDLTDAESVLRLMADGLTRMGTVAEQSAAGTELLGRAWQRLLPAFKDGAAAIDSAAAASARMGERSAFEREQLRRMDDQLDDTAKSWQRLSEAIGAKFAPAVDATAYAITFWMNEFTQAIDKVWLRWTDLINLIVNTGRRIGETITSIPGLLGSIGTGSLGKELAAYNARIDAIYGEENAIRQLIVVEHAGIGAIKQVEEAKKKAAQAAQTHADALKREKEQLDLYIRGLVLLGEEELKRQAIAERARIASGGVQVERGQAIVASAQTFGSMGMIEEEIRQAERAISDAVLDEAHHRQTAIENEQYALNAFNARMRDMNLEERELWLRLHQDILSEQREVTDTTIAEALHRKAVLDDEQYALNAFNARMQELNREERDLWLRLHQEVLEDQRKLTDSLLDESLHRQAVRNQLDQRRTDEEIRSIEFVNRTWDESIRAQHSAQRRLTSGWQTLTTSVASAFDTVVQGVLLGTQTIQQAVSRLGVDIVASLGRTLATDFLKEGAASVIKSLAAELVGGAAGSFGSVFGTASLGGGVTLGAMGLPVIGAGAAAAAGAGFLGSQIVSRTDFSRPKNQAGAALMAIPFIGIPNLLLGNPLGNLIGGLFDDGSAGRMRNESDFINGTVAAAQRYVERLAGANTPAALQRLLSNGQLPGERGGLYGTVTAELGAGGVLGGATIGFESMGQFRFLRGQLDAAAAEFVGALQTAVDTLIAGFHDQQARIVSQLTTLAQQTAVTLTDPQAFAQRRTGLNAALQREIDTARADMVLLDDPQLLAQQVSKIQALLQQRYQGEIQMVQAWSQKAIAAARDTAATIEAQLDRLREAAGRWRELGGAVGDQLDRLRLMQFGTPTAAAQLDFDRQRFAAAYTAFQSSRTVEAGQRVSELASPLLTSAAAAYGGDLMQAGYQEFWSQVVGALEDVQRTAVDQDAELSQHMATALDELQRISAVELAEQTRLEELIADNTQHMADSLDALRAEAASQFRAMGFSIPSFDVGTESVPRTGLALVHKGEEIVPVGGRSRRGGDLHVTVTGNTFIGTEPSMLRDLGRKLKPYINDTPSL